ncbi:probable apyrase 6 isoform X2 [Carica papaya]|uniref:probable apyrase 6 isoform X2 n=1 Tax=Carica papaya TaxID=3649 RepID=UPI000B8D056D|nr:probable apyrase 6 isoform X2 [Carica papaya]
MDHKLISRNFNEIQTDCHLKLKSSAMAYTALLSRASTAYFPLHRSQLHPRMQSLSPPAPQNPRLNRLFILLASLFTIPFLFYLFTTARRLHHSSKFADPASQFFGVHIHSSSAGSRVRVFEFLGEGSLPFVDSLMVRPGLADESGTAGRSLDELIKFAKSRVPRREWWKTKVQLMASGEGITERIFENYRRALRTSGFAFRDEWVRLVKVEEEIIYGWIAVNYAFGTLGRQPQETTGVVKLGGTSLQVIFALRTPSEEQYLRSIKLAGVTYYLNTRSLKQLGQNAAWKSLHEPYNSKDLTTVLKSGGEDFNNPCLPNGYKLTSNVTDVKLPTSNSAGNFSICRSKALDLFKRKQDKCLHPPCKIDSSFFLTSNDIPVPPENFFYISEYFGLVPSASLFELVAAGKHYCEDNWDDLKNLHRGVDDLDLVRYCFSSAYMVALLHDGLGLPMHEKRIGFSNHTGATALDWTLGAFIFQSVLKPPEIEPENEVKIVGSDSVTYFSLFAIILIALLAMFFVLQLRKPQLKIIYDLEKGHYTRVPR